MRFILLMFAFGVAAMFFLNYLNLRQTSSAKEKMEGQITNMQMLQDKLGGSATQMAKEAIQRAADVYADKNSSNNSKKAAPSSDNPLDQVFDQQLKQLGN
jgi:ABC-type cobalamin transport system ATPase subunit